MLELRELVAKDFEKNHSGRSYDMGHAINSVQKYVELGLKHLRFGDVFITYSISGDVVEFHCMNASDGRALTAAVNSALDVFAQTNAAAVTYYDNKRINDLQKFSKYPMAIKKIDDGEDRTFEAFFDLRGNHGRS